MAKSNAPASEVKTVNAAPTDANTTDNGANIQGEANSASNATENAPETKEAAPKVVASSSKEKTATFRAQQDHECIIGGVQYILTKGADHSLPKEVATILSSHGIGYTRS